MREREREIVIPRIYTYVHIHIQSSVPGLGFKVQGPVSGPRVQSLDFK